MGDKNMADKKEIAVRVVAFSMVYVLVAVIVLYYIGMEWLIIPAFII
ncbi:MAG: hypothetical protein HXS40_13030, partial [Theionarchaea archaeon]|nr:hypothetical protein [Theionarchaea archaeon]